MYLSAESSAVSAISSYSPIDLHAGKLTMRLSYKWRDVEEAQRLRYQVFYEEMKAKPTKAMRLSQRDIDPYDKSCDHLLVYDDRPGMGERLVGTYRLLRQSVADAFKGFYSENEFDLYALRNNGQEGQLLELGRSCVLPEYRDNVTINLLWRGIARYIEMYNISHMFGCASFSGTNVDAHAEALSYLYHKHLAPREIRAKALPAFYQRMNIFSEGNYDEKRAFLALPPLIKGYIRLGAKVGDGAFIDTQFNTTDVFIVMPVERITNRYGARFGMEQNG